jgi:hypothetical protein
MMMMMIIIIIIRISEVKMHVAIRVPPWFSYTLTESKVHSVPLRFIELRKTAF